MKMQKLELGKDWIREALTAPDVPPWVPRECRSALSECLAGLAGMDEVLPDGLLLLLAGSGATAIAIGIVSADQVEASPPTSESQQKN